MARSQVSTRRALTLIELLVSIMIVLMITAAAIPIMRPATQGRRTREAARLVQTYMGGAKSRAQQIGRPVGVLFERFNNQPFALTLSYVEIPAPYAGDTTSSRAGIASGQLTQLGQNVGDPMTYLPDTIWQTLPLKVGDLIQFNHQGRWYTLGQGSKAPGQTLSPPSSPPNGWTLTASDGFDPTTIPAPPDGLPFKILRQPTKTASPSLQLPESVAVDLQWSGASPGFGFVNPPGPTILFSPAGRLEALYDGAAGAPTLGTIYLLIGKREKLVSSIPSTGLSQLGDPAPKEANVYYNYQDLTNLWVTVGPQTGLIAVGENTRWLDKDGDGARDDVPSNPASDEVLGDDDLAAPDPTNDMPIVRGIAQQAQSMGGR